MEFKFDISNVLKRPITTFTADSFPKHPLEAEKAIEVIDEIGIASAKAQGLRGPVTTSSRLRHNNDHRVYIMREVIPIQPEIKRRNVLDPNYIHEFKFEPIQVEDCVGGLVGAKVLPKEKIVAIGLLKVGNKNLFVNDEYGRTLNINPLCVLDFYIHEKYQRRGFGKVLFDYMLMIEVISPSHLAYDRPSEKFRSFLAKYYGLKNYLPQANNFVIFQEYGLQYLDLNVRGRTANPKKNLAKLTKAREDLNKAALPSSRQDTRVNSIEYKKGSEIKTPDAKSNRIAGALTRNNLLDEILREESAEMNDTMLTKTQSKENYGLDPSSNETTNAWKAQNEARKARMRELLNSESQRPNMNRQPVTRGPPMTAGLSTRQQELISSAEGFRKNPQQYDFLYGNMKPSQMRTARNG